MRSVTATNINWQASEANAPWRARALQKPSNGGDFHGESRHTAPEKSACPRALAQRILRQRGTDEPVSFRHAPPRLTSVFTAQLLGQLLPDNERKPSAADLYGRPIRLLTLGFDARL